MRTKIDRRGKKYIHNAGKEKKMHTGKAVGKKIKVDKSGIGFFDKRQIKPFHYAFP
jgi:hypothetical protein